MKRTLTLFLSLLLLFYPSTAAAPPDTGLIRCYDFFGGGQELLSPEYDGEMFVGLIGNTLSYSADFQNWTPLYDQPSAQLVVRLKDEFVAVGAEVTQRSPDGIHYTTYQNPLPAGTTIDAFFCGGGRLLLRCTAPDGAALDLSTSDGIDWAPISGLVGDQFCSVDGVYYNFDRWSSGPVTVSADGLLFRQIADSIPGGSLCYYDGAFHTTDYSYEDGVIHEFIHTTTDFLTWSTEPQEDLYSPFLPVFPLPDGREVSYSPWGRLFYENGRWDYDFDFPIKAQQSNHEISIKPAERGLFLSLESRCYYLPDYETVALTYDRTPYQINRLFFDEGRFLIETGYSTELLTRQFYASTDGAVWRQYDYSGQYSEWLDDVFSAAPPVLEGDSGLFTLRSSEIDRKVYNDHRRYPLKATLTYPDGSTATVVYENSWAGSLTVYGDSGLFYLNANYNSPFLTRDGVTRIPCEKGVIGNGRFVRLLSDGTIESRPLSALVLPEEQAIRVRLNGEFLSFSQTPPVIEGSTFVPLRFLFERAGATVNWEPESATATVEYGGHSVSLSIGSDTALVDGVTTPLSTPARLINGQTFLPLRFLSERLGFTVRYDAAQHIADVSI